MEAEYKKKVKLWSYFKNCITDISATFIEYLEEYCWVFTCKDHNNFNNEELKYCQFCDYP